LHRDLPPRDLPSFPTRRSSDLLDRHPLAGAEATPTERLPKAHTARSRPAAPPQARTAPVGPSPRRLVRWTLRSRAEHWPTLQGRDRKSTRLNSSHVAISYAVFC